MVGGRVSLRKEGREDSCEGERGRAYGIRCHLSVLRVR